MCRSCFPEEDTSEQISSAPVASVSKVFSPLQNILILKKLVNQMAFLGFAYIVGEADRSIFVFTDKESVIRISQTKVSTPTLCNEYDYVLRINFGLAKIEVKLAWQLIQCPV